MIEKMWMVIKQCHRIAYSWRIMAGPQIGVPASERNFQSTHHLFALDRRPLAGHFGLTVCALSNYS